MGIVFNEEMILSTLISISVYVAIMWQLNKHNYGTKWTRYGIAILVSSIVPYLITPLFM
jgi:predicted DNA repair protein MutK